MSSPKRTAQVAPPAERPSRDDATRTVLDALRRLVRAFRVVGAGSGPSPAQRFVLERLAEHPGSSVGELAGMTHTDQSSVSVVVSRLVEAGYVERKRATDDARRAELSLTARGRAVAKRGAPTGQARLLAALAALPAARRTAVARELEGLVSAMGLEGEPAGMFFEAPVASSGSRGVPRRTTSASKTDLARR